MSTITLESVPNLGTLYARAAVMAVLPGSGDALPDDVVEVTTSIDRESLLRYQAVCGFRADDEVPATYPFVLTFPLAVHLMARPDFPFALPGLVHVHNVITQTRPLRAGEDVTLTAAVEDLRDHPKGRQFDLVLTASVDGEEVWRNVGTNLARGEDHPDATASGVDVDDDLPALARWSVPEDQGRDYAAVSGDRNPIHLSALSAKPFGFPRAIAHGMWTAARALAALEGRRPTTLEYEVAFRSPVLLPSTVAFRARPDGDAWQLAVTDEPGERTHLLARLTPA